jgi:hypothetical protein
MTLATAGSDLLHLFISTDHNICSTLVGRNL